MDSPESNVSNITINGVAIDILSSVFGSAASIYTGQPLDTIKVRLQVEGCSYLNPARCFVRTVREEGVRALWKGSVPALVGALSENSIAFALNGVLKKYISDVNSSFSGIVLAGGTTGIFSALALCPSDVLKCRSQVNHAGGREAGILHIAKDVLASHGLRGFYRGIGSQILRDIPFYAGFFGAYEFFCSFLKKNTSLKEEFTYFIAGGLAGQAGWMVSMPFDTIKSKIQTSLLPSTPSILSVSQDIVKEYGYRGFFMGIDVVLLRAFPANAALFLTYEYSKSFLQTILK